ncbi:MAG: glycosyl hydrolase [Eubacteriales bacterium]|nr:glycosyl hydrolase [Eubacteriales bacterium]
MEVTMQHTQNSQVKTLRETITGLLAGQGENYILPFFWQHGEDEETLREYMKVIQEANCNAVCVESRPHPDFCGPKWWADMDVILDEARTRGMKVWILDDSHFPTGYANGAVESAPQELCRQSICANRIDLPEEAGEQKIALDGLIPPPFTPQGLMEQYILPSLLENARHYDDDQVLTAVAFCEETGESVDLSEAVRKAGESVEGGGGNPSGDGVLCWEKPAGKWTLWVVGLSRNCGPHRNYINMTDRASCRLLIDAVYEPHWQHYEEDFGKTIAGFFSDEPELGNGHIYWMDNKLGTDQDLPFSAEMAELLTESLGANWAAQMYLLWENGADKEQTARVRYHYMDAVTKLVRRDFSRQLADWCHAHGVEYIGHLIEDGNAHARTGSSLGHYFRGLDGQDMAGIDDIGGQVYPQGEGCDQKDMFGRMRDGDFFHFCLGRLASSAAAIEPNKSGRAMCEIFGNYGWKEGVQLEKYLADHFMVRGVNHFVPHAFSPAPFPDPDCPPHFYAHGHNPQYRHFGALIAYMNRICALISDGHHGAEAAILYHAESEWMGEAMLCQEPAKVLEQRQIDFDFLPLDVFAERERYGTKITEGLQVGPQRYRALIVPQTQFITDTLAAIGELQAAGVPVVFLGGLPEGVVRIGAKEGAQGAGSAVQQRGGERSASAAEAGDWEQIAARCAVVSPEELPGWLAAHGIGQMQANPADKNLRVLHYHRADGEVYYFVNEGAQPYEGSVRVPSVGQCAAYNAWENRMESVRAKAQEGGAGTVVQVSLEPRKSLIVVFGEAVQAETLSLRLEDQLEERLKQSAPQGGNDSGETPVPLSVWRRSTCEGAAYPAFGGTKEISLPDTLAQEEPEFSGFVRYESSFALEEVPSQLLLEITDAAEGVEVFVNGRSAGLQIVPRYLFDLMKLVKKGENTLVIEVATTLERECYQMVTDPRRKMMTPEPTAESGITGEVRLWRR